MHHTHAQGLLLVRGQLEAYHVVPAQRLQLDVDLSVVLVLRHQKQLPVRYAFPGHSVDQPNVVLDQAGVLDEYVELGVLRLLQR